MNARVMWSVCAWFAIVAPIALIPPMVVSAGAAPRWMTLSMGVSSSRAAQGGPGAGVAAEEGPRPVAPGRAISRVLFIIYQRGAAPSKGQKCPMSPSCSEYGRLAVERFGLLEGTLMTADRLHRCGHDLRYYPTVIDERGVGSWDPPLRGK